MTQENLVLEFLKENKYITPARMGGKFYNDDMFGSKTTRVCRRLRAKGLLEDDKDPNNPKLGRFYLKRSNHTTQPLKDKHSAKYNQIQDDIANDKLQPSLSI